MTRDQLSHSPVEQSLFQVRIRSSSNALYPQVGFNHVSHAARPISIVVSTAPGIHQFTFDSPKRKPILHSISWSHLQFQITNHRHTPPSTPYQVAPDRIGIPESWRSRQSDDSLLAGFGVINVAGRLWRAFWRCPGRFRF